MPPELEEFRIQIIKHAVTVVARAPKIDNEAKTNASLVQPFLLLLGYDVSNPDEVSLEHHADFSEKYQNKVDYAIMSNGSPVIAVESKRVGAAMKDDRGQLKSYFNACLTIKLGILTDGLRFELYADSDKPNMMDESAFLRFNFIDIAKNGSIDDNTLDGLAAMRKGHFSPEDVGAEAKKKLLFESLVDTIKKFKSDPSDEFIRFVLGKSTVGGKINKLTQAIVDANREMIRAAMEAFVAQEALARFGYASKDLVRAPPVEPAAIVVSPASADAEMEAPGPSEAEMKIFRYLIDRSLFLIRSDILFQEVLKIKFRKSKSSLRIYYEKPNSGSLVDCREKDGKMLLSFPALENKELPFAPSAALDEYLLKSCTQRFSEAGISSDAPPVLRAIKGGQPGPTL